MTKTQALAHYVTTRALARSLDLAENTVSAWVEIPYLHQLRLESITAGYLRADDEAWHPALPRVPKTEHRAIVREADARGAA